MFSKILIANRGEIACRIIKTASRLGIKTVAVYSQADAAARHVALADEAIAIGPAPAKESYLVVEKIMAAAQASGAEAIHPGYGFLAENAEFAQACEKDNLVFIGPPVAAIKAMGSKSTAKTIMEKAGVPLLPGYHGVDQSEQVLRQEAAATGFPVLIKAVAGGGGKGMRIVHAIEDFTAELQAARREALAAFNDDRVLLEKYLSKPRHIEIQIFCDAHGNALHLFERDCSIQRRYQKVLEEAPAAAMQEERRSAMGQAAIAAAQAIHYVGAGTVEFIVAEDGTYYFMEMNTRLQVEHPVTELITGQDLVEWQLLIASGEKLPCTQTALSIKGHALEARVYAEEPDNDFLPATGRLAHLRFPAAGRHVRIDTGVRQGDSVTIHYDPMIAKLIVWDRDRTSCLQRMQTALGDTQVAGLATNISFLSALVSHPQFQSGNIDTSFIARHHDGLFFSAEPVNETVLALATLYTLLKRQQETEYRSRQQADRYSPWQQTNNWEMNRLAWEKVYFYDGASEHEVAIDHQDGEITLHINAQALTASGRLNKEGELAATLDDTRLRLRVVQQGEQLTLFHNGNSYRLDLINKTAFDVAEDAAAGGLNAPMPGKIVQVLVEQNEKVVKGMPLIILEAMKMEHTITAPRDGQVATIHFAVGDIVIEGAALLVMEE